MLTFAESLGFWELLIAKNQDIQKSLAFQGAFEKLFNVIESEGGIESRVNAESALTCVDILLRFNSANQVGCDLFHLSVFTHTGCRTTSVRVLSQLPSSPFFSSPRTYPHKNLHLNHSLFSSGMNLRRLTHLSWWGWSVCWSRLKLVKSVGPRPDQDVDIHNFPLINRHKLHGPPLVVLWNLPWLPMLPLE